MRELKFRAWLVPYRQSDGKPSKRNKPYYDYFDLWNEYGDDTWFNGASVECFEQYTGLKDKNGKEIYEGDIVRLLVSDKDFKKEFLEEYHYEMPTGDCQVFFECGAFLSNQNDEYYLPLGQYKAEEIEIIGNIHENPELLKKEK